MISSGSYLRLMLPRSYTVSKIGPQSLSVSYALPMMPKMAETAVHGCLHSGPIILLFGRSKGNVRYNCGRCVHFSGYKLPEHDTCM